MQGQEYKDRIYTAFLTSRTYLEPFLEEGQSLRGFLDKIKAMDLCELGCVQTAGREVGLVKELYSEAGQTSLQNAVSLVHRLQSPESDAALCVRLELQLCHHSSVELHWKSQDGRQNVLKEAEIDELERRLNFSRDDQAVRESVGAFLDALATLRDVAATLFELERCGHPCYQMDSHRLSLTANGAANTVEQRRREAEQKRTERSQWVERLHDLPKPARAMSGVGMCKLIYLVRHWDDEAARRAFLEAACSRAIEPTEDLDGVSHSVIKGLLCPVEQSLGLDPSSLADRCLASFRRDRCRIELGSSAAHADMDANDGWTWLHNIFLIPRAPSTAMDASEGRQYYCCFGEGGAQSVPAFIMHYCTSAPQQQGAILPSSCEVLWCCAATTTREDLETFFLRVRALVKRVFFVVGVDGLPLELRNEVYRLQRELFESRTPNADVIYCIMDQTQVRSYHYRRR